MASKTVTVGSSIGLHARPAGVIAEAATDAGIDVTIARVGGDGEVDAGSALLIMTLGAKFGDQVVVTSDDPAVVERVAALVEQDLDAV